MRRVTNPDSGHHRRNGENYLITPEEIAAYKRDGYIVIHDVLTTAEMEEIAHWFDHFVAGKEADRMARDFCDMSQPYGTPIEKFQLVNAMLPSKYRPELVNNIYHRVSQNIANQLYAEGVPAMDYEQFLAKRPNQAKAEFAMHQDLGYWPKTANTWTATFSLALSDSDIENGCLQVVPGTNLEPELRNHRPKGATEGDTSVNRDDSHTLVIDSKPTDEVVYLPVKRGSMTIHDERIVHGSGGNTSPKWRKTYVAAYRDSGTIAQERAMGFTHSHNDQVDWDEIVK
jgi:ectoine hydroxylase-related dioxygenase (phytanoyl-CoA dioxygenase family)